MRHYCNNVSHIFKPAVTVGTQQLHPQTQNEYFTLANSRLPRNFVRACREFPAPQAIGMIHALHKGDTPASAATNKHY
jgi:hypothetical protein